MFHMPFSYPTSSERQGGDLVMRRKTVGFGCHYGTALDDGRIAHTMPGIGKHVSSLEKFSEGERVAVKRGTRTPEENGAVQLRALSNLGAPYNAANANCEHNASYVHDGTTWSPMARSVLIGLVIDLALRWDCVLRAALPS